MASLAGLFRNSFTSVSIGFFDHDSRRHLVTLGGVFFYGLYASTVLVFSLISLAFSIVIYIQYVCNLGIIIACAILIPTIWLVL